MLAGLFAVGRGRTFAIGLEPASWRRLTATPEDASVPDPTDLFDHVYAERTPQLDDQKAWLQSSLEDHDPPEMEF